MKPPNLIHLLLFGAFLTIIQADLPAATTWGTVTEAQNGVFVSSGGTERAVKAGDVLQAGDVLYTSAESRAQVQLATGETARIGQNAVGSYDPAARTFTLTKGDLLIAKSGSTATVPPTQVVTPSARVSLVGDDVVGVRAGAENVTKVVSLSQYNTDKRQQVSVSSPGAKVVATMKAGEILTVNPKATDVFRHDIVDVNRLVKTSQLFNGFQSKAPTGASTQVKQLAQLQQRQIDKGNMVSQSGKLVQTTAGAQAAAAQVVNNVQVQTASGSRYRGNFAGTLVKANGLTGNLAMNILEDGRMTATVNYNSPTEKPLFVQGTVSNDGLIRGVVPENGANFTGQMQGNGSNVSGQTSAGSTFNATRQ